MFESFGLKSKILGTYMTIREEWEGRREETGKENKGEKKLLQQEHLTRTKQAEKKKLHV